MMEPRVQQHYTAYVAILNRNFTADLSFHNSPAFKKEAKGLQSMVSRIQIPPMLLQNNLVHLLSDPRALILCFYYLSGREDNEGIKSLKIF